MALPHSENPGIAPVHDPFDAPDAKPVGARSRAAAGAQPEPNSRIITDADTNT